ncbi:MAG: hypothetical protein N2511_07310 [Thermodesulfovibrionales bacterium]|nr:hypothetical protein [Thermodesulfovibrionales bacterium]
MVLVEGDRNKLLGYLHKTEGATTLDTLNNRKIIQKKVYLLQELGLKLNYYFGWYVYGPYSPELTRSLFEKRALLEGEDPSRIELTKEELELINKLNSMIKEVDPNRLDYWLELLASLAYLKSKEELQNRKPSKFKDDDIDKCLKILKKFNLVG